jgi:hypothetical protein
MDFSISVHEYIDAMARDRGHRVAVVNADPQNRTGIA